MAAKIEGKIENWDEAMELLQEIVNQMGGHMALLSGYDGAEPVAGLVYRTTKIPELTVAEADSAVHALEGVLKTFHDDMTSSVQAKMGVAVMPESKSGLTH
jgi:hypothetical protein